MSDVADRDAVGTPRELDLLLVLRQVADGITVQDRAGRLVWANDAAATLVGLSNAAEMLETPVADLLARFELSDEHGAPFPVDRMPGRLALAGVEAPEQTICYRIRSTGEERWSIVRATPVLDASGEVEYAINVFHDVTESRRAEQGVRFLAEASEVLAESLDYDRTLARVARLAVPRVADWCMVYMLQDDGTIARLAVEHAFGLHHDVLERLHGHEFDPDAGTGVPWVLRTGRPLLHEHADGRLVASDVHDPERLAAELAELGIVSWMCVPLTARGRTIGAISLLAAESGRRFEENDLKLAQELAGRAALAVDNARLYGEARESFALLDTLFETAPVGLAFFDADLRYVRVNDALAEINGVSAAQHMGRTMAEVLPEMHDQVSDDFRRVLATGEPLIDVDVTGGTPAQPGVVRHWVASYYPVRDPAGETLGLGAIVVETTERERAERERARLLDAERRARERLAFVAEASRVLASSLDYETTLQRVASLAVPELTDWCALDVVADDGLLRRLAVAHVDPAKAELARRVTERYPPDPDAPRGVYDVVRSGRPELVSEVTDEMIDDAAQDEEHERLMRELGLGSYLAVPIRARGRVLGVLTFVAAEVGRFDEEDLALAEDVARRAATAIENARLYGEARRRARAVQALRFVGDGVVLVDADGVVRLWNPAAERITGLPVHDVLGHAAMDAIPGWRDLAARVPLGGRAETVPLELDGRELWLSVSGVAFPAGTVFAFRDVTNERALEKLKSDFVSTVSHELRTPLAAIYGAAQTVRRQDVQLEEQQRYELVGLIASEADRLARIVNDILWASRLESGTMHVTIGRCDAAEIARTVVRATRVHLPPDVQLDLRAPNDLPPVAGDADKVRQVLANLVENAIKYSPDGGRVDVRLEAGARGVRFSVEDRGLGIPDAEKERIFEKFYRLDPHLTRGVGGTGLGLYICRELVRQMDGRIWLDSTEGLGSTFSFELPLADL
jgi:PAS domain S-box-containing protein